MTLSHPKVAALHLTALLRYTLALNHWEIIASKTNKKLASDLLGY